MRGVTWLMAFAMSFGVLGCESIQEAFDDDDDDSRPAQVITTTQPMNADTFVREAASAGMFEVESAQFVLDRNVGGEEATFARRMLNDHQRANQELRSAAQASRIPVPPDMMPKHKTRLDTLRSLQGQNLVRRYHEMQEQAHNEAVELFERASRDLSDQQLRSYAERTLPTLREHRGMLQQHRH